MPTHIYDIAAGGPMAMLLRRGKTPSAKDAATHIRRLMRHLRRHCPDKHLTIRGDGHQGRSEVMAFCETAGADYVFGLPTNSTLRGDSAIVTAAYACAVRRAEPQLSVPHTVSAVSQ